MRLAATLTTISTERASPRQSVTLRGTLRARADIPNEIAIVDVSESGFLAELPADVVLPLESRVRVAATLLGTHDAVVVRHDGSFHGFAFARALDRGLIGELDGDQPSTVTPFPGAALAAPDDAASVPEARLSPRMSLAIMIGVSAAIWAACASVVIGVALLA